MINLAADKNRRVLIIDDNRSIHADFRKILSPATATVEALEVEEVALFGDFTKAIRQSQFEVNSAYQGEEGLLLVKKALEAGLPYATAFVDVRMPPGWDGVETAQKIWELDPNIQIVLCTAYSDYSWDEMFEKLGLHDGLLILKKPFDAVEAFQLAHALMEKWWLHQQSVRKMEELESRVAERTRELQQTNRALQMEVAEHERVEETLRASEERYRSLFESNPNPMWVYDLETLSFLAVNATAVRHYGYSQDEFLAMTIKDVRPSEDIPALMADLSRATGDVKNATHWRHCRKDKTMIEVEITSHKLTWLGRRAKLVLINDITERNRAESRIREQADIINRAHDAIIVCNFEDQGITFWNKGAEQLYGWSAEEAIGKPIGELIFANEKEREASLKTLMSTGEFHGETRQVAMDGRQIIADVRATLVRDPDGEPLSVLLITADVTDQKKLETQLLRAQRLESIGTLASGVAHDLNNILAPILCCAQTLRGDLDAEELQSAVSLIEDSAQRGANVVKQVLTFARGIEGERVLIKPTHLIEEMVDIARQTFPKLIQITGRYPEDLWTIQGDPTQLYQVLLNLSVNARDAMPNGGSLTLAAENFMIDENYAAMTADARVGPYVILRITDSGAGMPRATIDKIFDPFFTTKEIGKGTGLGLSTVLGIVKSHGGFISLYSEIGQGTTFRIFLPATISDEDLRVSRAVIAPVEGKGEQILVVDDEPNILRVTKMIFEKHNYRFVSANDGPEALALFAQKMDSIGGVLTDISMPYMDGVALVRSLRRMKSDIPIIASTGQGDQSRMSELQSLGVKNFLTKPYNLETLLTTVHDTLSGASEPSH